MSIACADFADASLTDDLGLSRGNLKFLNIVEDSGKHYEDGHYQISFPLKNPCLKMPENRVQAEPRALYLNCKLSRDAKFREDYVAFLENVIEDGFAERVPLETLRRTDGKVWFIPHHSVYHKKSQTK